ncbi:protease complex subunit PrcB family protein [Lachnospiraceae bacterium 45-P1]
MLRKWKKPGKKILSVFGILAVLVAGCIGFTGCHGDEEENAKVQDLEFTVIGENEIPPALAELIGKKREKPFKLTYADGQDMYIVIGEGPQAGGGYSVVVKELYQTDNSIVIRTELLGPEKGEASGTDTSYPVLIVKTAFMEEPVVFQ